jgi:hypothetical protein
MQMRQSSCWIGLVAVALVGGGCDNFDYYPGHEMQEKTSDLRKQGPDNYGGNNSNYPVGTPGTSGTTQPISAVPTAVPAQPSNGAGPTINARGHAAPFDNTVAAAAPPSR